MPSKPPSEPMPSSGNGRDDAGLPPSAESPIDPVAEFVRLNEEAIARLATFIDFAEGFTIGFVEINFLADLDILIRHLAQHPSCQDAQFIEFDLGDPTLRFLKDALLNRLQASHLEPDKNPVLWLKGLEQSIGMSGEYPPMLTDLNFVRDAYTDQVPYLVLFCLPDYAINRVIKFAPDFWSWGSGVFRFQTRPSTQQQAADNTIFSERIRGSLQIADWQERIDQLERLAMEYRPSSDPSREELENYCRALRQLGIAYDEQGETVKGEYYLRQALKVADEVESLQLHRGMLLHELGYICQNTGRVQEAKKLYQQSLDIEEQIGNVQGQAATLHQLGILQFKQEEIEAAIQLFEESVGITRQIGYLPGLPPTLDWLAGIAEQQGDIAQAETYLQEALAIAQRVGSPKAAYYQSRLARLQTPTEQA